MKYDKKKYRPGMCRYSEVSDIDRLTSHLYELGDGIMDFKLPMCHKGWNGSDGTYYSILRGRVSDAGICKTCLRRAAKNLPGVLPDACDLEAIFAPEAEETWEDWDTVKLVGGSADVPT